MTNPRELPTLLRAQAARLRAEAAGLEALAEQFADVPTPAGIITGDTAAAAFPSLTPRVFADGARAGAFPAFKIGRRTAAKREDVAAWLEARKVRPRPKRPTPIDPAAAYADLVGGAGWGR